MIYLKNNRKIIILQLIAFVVLVAVTFIFRFYKLDQRFEFFGDIARDHERLMEWYQGAKPPLLGPNTILMIINQSPWFYYLNFPVFLITKSPFTMTITLFFLSTILFALSLWILRNRKEIFFIYIIFFLSSIHPMFVDQQRIPWNPSFAVPFLIFGISGMLYLKHKYHSFISLLTAISLCLAIGMTYTVFPIFLTIIIYIFFSIPARQRNYWLLHLGIAMFIVFFPLVIFEIKSNFFTIRRFGSGLNIPPLHTSGISKLSFFAAAFFSAEGNIKITIWQMVLLIVPLITNCYFAIKNTSKMDKNFMLFVALAILVTIFTLVMPFQQSYYLYGVILLWYLVISSMRPVLMIPVLFVLIVLWINPVWMNSHFGKAIRPVSELDNCARKFCTENPGTYYVSSNSWLGIHSAHEHAFMLNKYSCRSRDIVSFPSLHYDKMIVVADKAKFEPHKTSYFELEQFGNYDVLQYMYCTDDIQYWLLKKK